MHLESLMQELEKDVIMHALKLHDGNYAKAAQSLGIHRGTLYKKIKKYEEGGR